MPEAFQPPGHLPPLGDGPEGTAPEGASGPEALPIRFPSGDGECAADLYLPGGSSDSSAPPVVLMAPGIGAERTFGLEPYARRFTTYGMAALVFDYRHFGGSTGEPRNLVSPPQQVEDYLAAMAFVRRDPRLDGTRMGLWGTSFSGGHVLVAAARHPPGLQAVVSQIPFVSGLASTLAYPLRFHLPAIALGVADRFRASVGLDRVTVPVVRQGGGFALLASPDSHAGYTAIVDPEAGWSGRVPAEVFLQVLVYHPSRSAPRIRVPTLILAATNDAICPASAARRAARRIPDARYEEFPIGHFEPYHGRWFEALASREAAFLESRLRP